ncbi:DNA (cytosine-5-)-methyltransferase [Demequina gelatinilytica]|uniref:DNA (cytosine-5-)-methyltransferase n=1 Tax=Demequina gelatinilytica TaxID=1638980 RepID=UPI0007828F41|nr:DNA (cytosine-5-)-methyltransferase [Demequina gelatinilytica]
MSSAPQPAFTYADLFAGIGGFHAMLEHGGGHCVYVSEIDAKARDTYARNWIDPLPESSRPQVNTDITTATPAAGDVDVPAHDVLAAGFPCQPFSKSGMQRGMDEARGALFWNIARVLEDRKPAVVLLENVRNIAGPRHRHEWEVIIATLRELGYRVSDRPTLFSPHLLPPELGGTPQVRDRVFIVGTYIGPARVAAELAAGLKPEPVVPRAPVNGWDADDWRTEWILDDDSTITDLARYQLTDAEREWIDVWDDLVARHRRATGSKLPGFPLWTDHWVTESSLDPFELGAMPAWRRTILTKNARFYDEHRKVINAWFAAHPQFESFPASRRKLEWQARELESLWETVMHFRPSGIRAKAPTYLPALVAITQTSIYGPRARRLTPHEAARLQGLPLEFTFGDQKDPASYKQVGNGVAVGAAWHVFRTHVEQNAADLPSRLVESVLGASRTPETAVSSTRPR